MKPSLNLRGLLPLVSLSIARCSDIIDPHLMTRALQKWTCAASTECGAEEYCASGICRSMGTCGQTLDCFNPSNFYWKTECVGTTECMDGVCGVECGDSFCPNSDEVNCLARPCETTTCNQSNEFCVDNYCGGCNAIFFDAAGRQVCRTSDMFADEVEGNETKAEFVNETTTSCSRDNDCNAEHYCSSGSCRAFGTCGELVDCFNPGNIYPVVLCVGPLSCNKVGRCGVTCSDSFCPRGQPETNCSPMPCDSVFCGEDYKHCANYNCGGCHAFFLNDSGAQVCKDAADLSNNRRCDLSCDARFGLARLPCVFSYMIRRLFSWCV